MPPMVIKGPTTTTSSSGSNPKYPSPNSVMDEVLFAPTQQQQPPKHKSHRRVNSYSHTEDDNSSRTSHKPPRTSNYTITEIVTEAVLLWITVAIGFGPVVTCPNDPENSFALLTTTLPLLLIDTFEVVSFLVGIRLCPNQGKKTFNEAQCDGLVSGGAIHILPGLGAVVFGGFVNILIHAIFLSKEYSVTEDGGITADDIEGATKLRSTSSTWENIIRSVFGVLAMLSL